MERAKVSIVLPCYNGADTIERAVRGILNQTYRPIQLILVNDGSTDATDQVVRSMREEIDQAQIEFQYFPQENMGLGGAVNSGLKHVTGEYLAWVDADDELMPESVELRVDFLEQNRDYGSVSSNAVFAEDRNWEQSLGKLTDNISLNGEEDQFIHLLMGRSIFCCGCHMVRKSVFVEANGGLDIYPARHGQNWQMLLPVYYVSKHAFLDLPLYKYRTNADNMSAAVEKMSMKQLCQRRQEYLDIVSHTLKRIKGMSDKEKHVFSHLFKKHICELNLDSALEQQDRMEILKWKIAVKWMNLAKNATELCKPRWNNTENHR